MGPKVELRGEDVIQAVVVADSFSSAFAPLTLATPGCLLPLAGRPLLEYTLEVRVTCHPQCCGSGSVGSICFWTSWILLLSSINCKENIDSYCFVTSL
jgi:hypothetical protein